MERNPVWFDRPPKKRWADKGIRTEWDKDVILRTRAQAIREVAELVRKDERERIEKQFIWGQVPYYDIESGTIKEWTMRCISDDDWQALKGDK